jgi:hypothetical protein
MRKFIFLIFLFFFIIVLAVYSFNISQEATEEEQKSSLYPTTSFKYRGVVAVDIGDGDAAHELVCDFGDLGVWVYDVNLGWFQISSEDPDWIIGVQFGGDDYEILADFGYLGLWIGDYAGLDSSWKNISLENPDDAIVVDDDGDGHDEIQVRIHVAGLWRYDADTDNWSCLTREPPVYGLQSDIGGNAAHEEGVWSFPNYGAWLCYIEATNNVVWRFLGPDFFWTNNASVDLGVGDSGDEIVLDYLDALWVYQNDGSPQWNQISANWLNDLRAVRFVGDSDYELAAVFQNIDGLWIWDDTAGAFPGTWIQLTGDKLMENDAFCEPFDPDGLVEISGDEELAAVFMHSGLWMYDSTTSSWTHLSPDLPEFMVRADLNGHGVDDCLVCDFGILGLWYYDGYALTWNLISPDSPEPGFN